MNEENQKHESCSLNIEEFNVSGEFEDIELVINHVTGQAEMMVVARRC